MKRSTYRPFNDVARPLSPHLRFARFMTAPAGDEGAGAPPAAPQPPADPPAAPADPPASTPPAAAPTGDGLPDDPAALKTMIADLRKENGAARTNAKQQAADEARTQLVTELGKALGLVKDGDAAPKPEELTAQVEQAQQAARQAQVELAVYRTATTHRGDPAALLDSRSFLAKVADLDPADAEFQTKVSDAVKAAVTENPKLRAQVATGASSIDHAGGSGEGAITKDQFDRMGYVERSELYQTNPTLYRQLTA